MCADLVEAADDVNLKLSLWQGREDFEDLGNTWRASSFESLNVTEMEDAINRYRAWQRHRRDCWIA
jgi:hypothetical protein